MARDHAADAGGDAAILVRKRRLRDEVWGALSAAGAARFPGARGRIPNFTGAEAAAERLRGVDAWQAARALKANPDSPQWPVRQRALEDGMVLYMAVPRLAESNPFFLLDPHSLPVSARAATSIRGAGQVGRPVAVGDLGPVDLVVTGSVAVDATGARLGKGGGFADLEFAVASRAGLIGEETLVVTTVHPLQILEPGRIPMTDHDVPLDLVVTADEVIRCEQRHPRPDRILWDDLTPEKVSAIPLLALLRAEEPP